MSLRDLGYNELIQVWNNWLMAAQCSNDLDADEYSHSAFLAPALWPKFGIGAVTRRKLKA